MSLSTSKECRTLVFIIIGFCSIGILAITPQHRAEASTFKTLGDTSTLMSQIVQTASESVIQNQIQTNVLLQPIVSHSFAQANAFSYEWTIKNNPKFIDVPLNKLVPSITGETGKIKISVPDNFLMRDYSADRLSQSEHNQGGFDILVYDKNLLFYEGTKLMAINELSGKKQPIATLMADAVKAQNATHISYEAFKFTSGFLQGSKSRPITIVEANVTSKQTPILQHYWRVYLYIPEIDSVISIQLFSDPMSLGQEKVWNTLLQSILKKSPADKITTKSKTSKNTSKYQNDLFSITLPSGWVEAGFGNKIQVGSPDGKGVLIIDVAATDLVTYKHTYYNLLADQFKSKLQNEGYNVINTQKTKLGDSPAIKIDSDMIYLGIPLRHYTITTVKDGLIYTLTGTTEEASWDKYKNVIEKSFKTFKFKD